jgi:hypothetical protein
MHTVFSLLRIKGLYTFRSLRAHPQEVLHRVTWYFACVLCQLAAPGLEFHPKTGAASRHNMHAIYQVTLV